MSQSAMLWERVLKRHPKLEADLSDNSEVESSDEPDDPADDKDMDDPFKNFNPEINSEDSAPAVNDDPADDQGIDDLFKNFNPEINSEDSAPAVSDDPTDEPDMDDPFKNFNPEINIEDSALAVNDEPNDAPANAGTSVPVVDRTFEDSADLWLTQARKGLEHALSAMGIRFSEIFPTNRPLLVFGSRRTELAEPEYHRVKIKREGWPCRLHSTEPLTVNAAATILASSVDEPLTENPPYFEGETVAVEVPNPLLAADRWIVLWPILESLPEWAREASTAESTELHQWERVRRVVWCVNRKQIGPRDVLSWLSRFWRDTPIRIALFRAASFVDEKRDMTAQSRALPRVRQTLEKFDGIKGHPWIVVGP